MNFLPKTIGHIKQIQQKKIVFENWCESDKGSSIRTLKVKLFFINVLSRKIVKVSYLQNYRKDWLYIELD